MAEHGGRGGRVGLLISTRQAALGTATMRELVALASTAEEAGFGSVWAGESIVAKPRPDLFTFLAACAAATSEIRLGAATALPALHHPIRFAHQIATVDQLSEGRLVVGVGAGFPGDRTRSECDALGVDYDQRRWLMHDVVGAARSALGEDGAGRLTVEPAPHQRRLPFWLGGEGPRTKQRCGADYDGWMPTAPTPERFAAGLSDVRAAAARAGRDPADVEAATILTVVVDDDRRAAARALTEYLQAYYRTDAPLAAIADVVGAFAGTADECTERVLAFLDAGAGSVIVRFAVGEQTAALRTHGRALVQTVAAAAG